MMNCHHFNKQIYSYCDGKVPSELRLDMEKHISVCDSCRNNYKLTLIENQVLHTPVEIPELSANFTSELIKTITESQELYTGENSLNENHNTSRKRPRFFPIGTLIAASILICLYISGINPFTSNEQIAQKTPEISQTKEKQSYGKINPDQDAVITGSKSDSIQNYKAGNINQMNKTAPINQPQQAAVDSPSGNPSTTSAPGNVIQQSAPPSSDSSITKRFTVADVGRAGHVEKAALDNGNSLTPQNVPSNFKLSETLTDSQNNTIYNYLSEDGSEELSIELAIANDSSLEVKAIDDAVAGSIPTQPTATGSANMITRNLDIQGKNLIVTYSGNLPPEELAKLAETIEFK